MDYDQVMSYLYHLDPYPYSGLGMYGRVVCPAVNGARVQDVLADIVLLRKSAMEVDFLIRHAKWDSMGTGVVVYWPVAAIDRPDAA